MRKITFLFACLLLLAGLRASAQIYTMNSEKATTLSTGKYVIQAFCEQGTGLVYHQEGVTDRPIRYTVGKAVNNGVVVESNYVWSLTKDDATGLITLQNVSTGLYFNADAEKNKNMTISDGNPSVTASLKPEVHTIGGTDYFSLWLNETVGWIHANKASGMDPNLSYWPAYGDGGTCVKFTFYPVTEKEAYTVTFNYKSWGTESVLVGTNSVQMLPNAEITASSVPAIDFFGNYQVASGLTATKDNMTVEVTCDPAFPFTSGDMCLLKVSNNQYLNRLSDSQTTTGATNMAVARLGGFYIPAHVQGTANLFTFQHVNTGKYLTVANATNQTQPTYGNTPTAWVGESDETNATGATSYFRVTKNGDGFNIQHPGNAEANMGNHISGNLGFWTHPNSSSAPGSRILVETNGVVSVLQVYITSLESASAGEYVDGIASESYKNAIKTAKDNPTQANVQAYVAEESYTADGVDGTTLYQLIFTRGTKLIGHYGAEADANGVVSEEGVQRVVAANASGDLVSSLWRMQKQTDGTYKLQNVNSGFWLGNVDGNVTYSGVAGHLVVTKENQYGKGYTLAYGGDHNWTFQDLSVDGDNYLNTFDDNTSNGGNKIGYWKDGFSDEGNKIRIKKVTEIPVVLNSATDASYATLCLPFPVKVKEGDAAKVYAVTRETGANYVRVALVEDGAIPAGVGVLLKNDAADAGTATFTVLSSTDKTQLEGNVLDGATVKRTGITSTDYLTFGYTTERGIGFYRPNATELKANRAFITDTNGELSSLSILFEDEVTGVKVIEALQSGEADLPVYDLSGRRVMNPIKGIYIRGGKKIAIQ